MCIRDSFVAEVGDEASQDQIYRLTYDGQVADEHRYAVMGGAADVVAAHLSEHYREGGTLAEAVQLAVAALGHSEQGDRRIGVDDLEVAVLDRSRSQVRKFHRLRTERLAALLAETGTAAPAAGTPAPEGDTAP